MQKQFYPVTLQTISRKSGNVQHYVTVPEPLLEQSGLDAKSEFIWNVNESGDLSLRTSHENTVKRQHFGLSILDEFWKCWEDTMSAFRTKEQWINAGLIAIGDILNEDRHTLSNALVQTGLQEQDWNRFYRLFSHQRVCIKEMEKSLIRQLLAELPPDAPVLLVVDDTQVRKSGRKIPWAQWLRDKLGPKFTINLIWGLRFLQVSIAIPSSNGGCRCYPISFMLCPTPGKLRKKATEDEKREYKSQRTKMALPIVASKKINELIKLFNGRKVIIDGDGGFTNKKFVRNLPDGSEYLGRIRKDAHLVSPPQNVNTGKGRRTFYGPKLPTPHEIYKDKNIKSKKIKILLNGKEHIYTVKSIIARSEIFGNRNLRVICVGSVPYERGNVKVYREQLFLVTTDLTTDVEMILRSYIWRWEIELNFKDEKSLFGINHPQVWNKQSVETRIPFVAMVYSLFLLACHRTFGEKNPVEYARWRDKKEIRRASAKELRKIFQQTVIQIIQDKRENKTGFDCASDVKSNLLFFLKEAIKKKDDKVICR